MGRVTIYHPRVRNPSSCEGQRLTHFQSGMGTGIAMSAVFIALQAAIDPVDKAVAASGLYLTGTIGCIVGVTGSSATTQVILRRVVQVKLAQQGMEKSLIDEVSNWCLMFFESSA